MQIKEINSVHNPTIKQVAMLHTAQGRAQYQQYIAEGTRICGTIINSGQKLLQAYCTAAMLDECLTLCDSSLITIVTDAVIKKISTMTTPSGIVCVFAIPQQPNPEQLQSGLVLAQIADPGNMGTLIRSCAAFGKKSVAVIEGVDPFSPKVIQASAGTIAHVNLFLWSWKQLQQYKKTLQLCGLTARGGTTEFNVIGEDALLVVGNEAHGIPQAWQNECDVLVTLPMPGNTESLNAAIAGSIAMYHAWVYTKE